MPMFWGIFEWHKSMRVTASRVRETSTRWKHDCPAELDEKSRQRSTKPCCDHLCEYRLSKRKLKRGHKQDKMSLVAHTCSH